MLKAYIQRDSKFMPQSATCIIGNDVTTSSDLDATSNDFGPSATDIDTGFVLDHLELEQIEQLHKLLSSFSDIFYDKPGHTKLCDHKIELQLGTKPIRLPPYRLNAHKSELIRKELDLLIDMGVIEESNSPWAVPVVIVPKPDGSARFCCDFAG